jgi:hypothetical protein
MKIHIFKYFLGMAMMTLLLSSCEDVLDEQPRTFYEPSYFQTESGVEGGLTSLYEHLRNIYGHAYFYNSLETGTDEATYAQSADQNFKQMDISGVGEVTSDSYPTAVLWDNTFSNINTASGIIENASAVGISEDLIAEAYFFRAFDYFLLVQYYGGVPLDLGAGELAFNTSTTRASTRNTVPEVYTRAIFPDLIKAVEDLNETGRVTGGVTKTLARCILAKAYLTYGWWLENPNNIATYPAADRVDPDGQTAQWYFQQAYDIATTAIDNPGEFGLQETYYDVNLGSNDRNNEILLYADHTETSEYYNGSSLTYSSASTGDNCAAWMVTWNYTVIRSATDAAWSSVISSVKREAVQSLGRPWTRMCPTIGVVENTFADKTIDSRYDGTFVTSYRGNWQKGGDDSEFVYNANSLPVYPDGAILSFLDEEPTTDIVYPDGKGNSNIGAGELPGRSDFVVSPQGISRVVYPGLWKIGTYRTDNGDGLGSPNGALTRPFNAVKFSELYFIAAEAAVKGASTQAGKSARELINVIRARAGVWRWDNGDDVERVEENSAAMTAATPVSIDIDYILAERSREYYGEGYRWYDLVRTQKWEEYSSSYEICGTDYGDHTSVNVSRSIQNYHYLRPIPQSQIDALEMTTDEKNSYQNPGY